MLNPLPPLQTLRAFEATGRLLSMSLAAAELNLTAGAISRQIRVLEDDLGVALFRRMTRRIVLTEEGAAFHQVVSRTLGELSRETERLRSSRGSKRLTISTSVSFASKWLGTRFHRLIARLPDVDLHLEVSDVNIDLGDRRVDAAIRYGTGVYQNTVSERILDETMSPVCSPEYRVRAGGLTAPSDLLGCTQFKRVSLQAIAAGFRVPYELISGDLAHVSYISGRLGMQEFYRLMEQVQWQILIPMFCERVWVWFCGAAYDAGLIPTATVAVEWSPPRMPAVDPFKQAMADLLDMRAGTRSHAEIVHERGRNPDDVLTEIVAFNAAVDAAGIVLDSDPRKVAKSGVLQVSEAQSAAPEQAVASGQPKT